MRTFRQWLALTFLVAGILSSPSVLASFSAADDWAQWRGPTRDGTLLGFNAPPVWPKSLKEEWKVTVGVGHSSPVMADGKVYVFARRGEEEKLLCLDAATGR